MANKILFKWKFILKSVIFLVLFYSCAISKVKSQTSNNDFFCSDSFCPEWLRQFPCSTNSANCNTTGFREFLDPDRCNCCKYCFDYLKENTTCSPNSLEKPIEMCGPSLECRIDPGSPTASCKQIGSSQDTDHKPKTECLPDRIKYFNDKKGIVQFLPDCDAHGYYSPRQCLPGSMCYCSNRLGKRIFGESIPNEPQDCACARDAARLQDVGFEGTWPHCLPNGDYDDLQCVIRSCFCRSNPSTVVYHQNITTLPCFNKEIHTFDPEEHRYYTRECEHRRAELEVERLEAEMKGIIMITSDLPRCGLDGNFDRIQPRENLLFCSRSDGTQIEKFEARKFTKAAKEMNCYCARARDMLADSATGKPKCCCNGNYRPYQCVGSICYCVDEEGKQDVNIVPHEVRDSDSEINTLPCVIKAGGKDNVCPRNCTQPN